MEPVSPVPRSKGLRIAQIVETDNAAPRRCNICDHTALMVLYHKHSTAVINTSQGALRCFVFNYLLEVAKFLLRQNQSVSNAFIICMRPPPYRTFKRMDRREANDLTDMRNLVFCCFGLSVVLTSKTRQMYENKFNK